MNDQLKELCEKFSNEPEQKRQIIELLKTGADLNYLEEIEINENNEINYISPLIIACKNNNLDLLDFLIENGVKINFPPNILHYLIHQIVKPFTIDFCRPSRSENATKNKIGKIIVICFKIFNFDLIYILFDRYYRIFEANMFNITERILNVEFENNEINNLLIFLCNKMRNKRKLMPYKQLLFHNFNIVHFKIFIKYGHMDTSIFELPIMKATVNAEIIDTYYWIHLLYPRFPYETMDSLMSLDTHKELIDYFNYLWFPNECFKGIYEGKLIKIEEKLENVNEVTFDGWNILHVSIYLRKTQLAVEIIQKTDIDLNAQNSNGQTALHMACFYGYDDIVHAIINKLK